jgi:hypothetical protein
MSVVEIFEYLFYGRQISGVPSLLSVPPKASAGPAFLPNPIFHLLFQILDH